MLLILEIFLTVRAWKAGWKALALLPLGFAVAAGFAIGLLAPELLRTAPFAVVGVDLVFVAVLVGMVMRPRQVPSANSVQLSTAA